MKWWAKAHRTEISEWIPAPSTELRAGFAGMTVHDTQYDMRIEEFSVCKGLTRVQPYRKQISLQAEFRARKES